MHNLRKIKILCIIDSFENNPIQAQAYAQIPSVNMWDDHVSNDEIRGKKYLLNFGNRILLMVMDLILLTCNLLIAFKVLKIHLSRH